MNSQSNQYKQIFKTYWQRPLIVLFALLLLPIVLILALGETGGNVMQIGPRPHAPSRIERVYTDSKNVKHDDKKNIQTLSELLERVDPEKVTALNMMRLHDDDRLPDLSPFQNLVYLKLDSYELTDANVDQICDLPKLDALVASGTRFPAGTIQRFGQKVSQLELLALTLEAHPDEIPRMSKVKLLALHLVNASPELLNYVVQIPQLEQLTLVNSNLVEFSRRYPRKPQAWEYIDLNEQQLALLRNHSTLKEVYADWFYMQHHGKFEEGAFLPVHALPITYSKNKRNAIGWTMFAMALLFSILSIQLWGHFISPAASVVPHYLAPHRRVAVGIFSVGVLLLWLTLLRYDFGMLPSFSLILFLPTICCSFSIVQLSGKTYPQWLAFPTVLSLFLIFPLFTEPGFKTIASTAIWYLWGQMPIPALTIIAIELVSIAWSLTKLPAITELVNETYTTMPALSPWDRERVKQIPWKKMNKSFLWIIDYGTTGLKYCGESTWQMVHLWRQGNTFRPMMILMFLSMMIFFGLLFQGIRCLVLGEALFSQDLSWMSGAFGGPCGIAVILPIMIWWQRRKSLEVESMRPICRQKIVKQLYLSLALDHWVVVICIMGINIPGLFEALKGKTEALGFLLFGIAGLLWMIGISSSVLVFKRSWVIVLNIFVLTLLPFAVLLPVAILNSNNFPDGVQDVQLLIQFACMGIVAAIGLNVVMYRVFLKREWG
ncbi:MAG: hypothetical protein K0U86_03680 [Planctomycetes bacterium]|nr:hypothetical protein [Planctomycetota bacterium]MCH9723985.1 hypothetical protein [Planctomycetota bacterium]MCH9774870.1 hypothetical protein [Planctomycetota bacterium]